MSFSYLRESNNNMAMGTVPRGLQKDHDISSAFSINSLYQLAYEINVKILTQN